MKDNAPDDTVVDRLEAALDADMLPKAARDYAQHLLSRLSQPVRVSILGKPGSGKSELVNMILGRKLIPAQSRLPTTEFAWGESETMTVTSAGGAVQRIDGVDLGGASVRDAAFLRLELPADILKRINLLEVVTEESHNEIESAVDWAVRRTDIALWCSQAFDQLEQSVWGRVPDSLKDHAFLVLTKADVLSAEKVLSKRVADLESIVAEEFHSLFAVATLQAIRAYGDDGVDEAMFHASGGGALTSEVLRHAERGRRADFDSAHMFLARYQVRDVPKKPRIVSSRDIEPAPGPKEVPAEARKERPISVVPSRSPEAQASGSAAAEAVATVQPIEVAVKIQNIDLFTDAARFLRRRGETLADATQKLGEGNSKELVNQCVDAVEHLVDLFSQDDTGCDAVDAYIDELAEASDMMVLMQVEDGDGPAADAVTLLLQLRRDIEMQLAA